MPLLQVENLNTWFYPGRGIFGAKGKPLKALDDVSFSIDEGSTVGVIGNLGCGKTVLAQTLAKLVPATSGRVLFEDREILSLSQRAFRPMRRHLQIVFEDATASLDPTRPIIATLLETVRAHNRKTTAAAQRKTALALLDYVGLPADTANLKPAELGHGQAERIALARALAPQPKLLIIDNTLQLLDSRQQCEFVKLFVAARDELKLSCLLICHDIHLLSQLTDHALVMSRGRIVEAAPTEQLLRDPQHDFTRKLLESTLSLD
jgi:ABC-type glutathione transport system ATPase component